MRGSWVCSVVVSWLVASTSTSLAHAEEFVSYPMPLIVYGAKPLTVEDLKDSFGDSFVTKAGKSTWAVNRKLRLWAAYDLFLYEENARGELIEMTGFLQAPCDVVLDEYRELVFGTSLGRGAPLPATAEKGIVKINLPADKNSVMNYGGQTITFSYAQKHAPHPCSLITSYRRR